MNSDQVAGNWKQMMGRVRKAWGALTDDDLAVINGDKAILAGKIQERYGIRVEEARHEVTAFFERVDLEADSAIDGDPVTTETLKIGM